MRTTCECCGEPLALMPAQPAPTQIEAREWNGHAIQRRHADGYVNATAMCKANGRHLPHYLANDRTTEYLQALSGSVGIPTDLLKVSIGTGPNHLRGTWIHPRLAVDLARWIIPQFAVWMDGWFLEQFTTPLPTTTNRQPTVNRQGPPQIVIYAANAKAAESIWDRALTNAMVDRITTGRRFRGRIRRPAGGWSGGRPPGGPSLTAKEAELLADRLGPATCASPKAGSPSRGRGFRG